MKDAARFFPTKGLWARCPTSLPSRKVSDECLGRDETNCARLATNNVLSQVTDNFIVDHERTAKIGPGKKIGPYVILGLSSREGTGKMKKTLYTYI